jgi:hypothetical protein
VRRPLSWDPNDARRSYCSLPFKPRLTFGEESLSAARIKRGFPPSCSLRITEALVHTYSSFHNTHHIIILRLHRCRCHWRMAPSVCVTLSDRSTQCVYIYFLLIPPLQTRRRKEMDLQAERYNKRTEGWNLRHWGSSRMNYPTGLSTNRTP